MIVCTQCYPSPSTAMCIHSHTVYHTYLLPYSHIYLLPFHNIYTLSHNYPPSLPSPSVWY